MNKRYTLNDVEIQKKGLNHLTIGQQLPSCFHKKNYSSLTNSDNFPLKIYHNPSNTHLAENGYL